MKTWKEGLKKAQKCPVLFKKSAFQGFNYLFSLWNVLRNTEIQRKCSDLVSTIRPPNLAAKAVLPVEIFTSLHLTRQTIKTILPDLSLNYVLAVVLTSVE